MAAIPTYLYLGDANANGLNNAGLVPQPGMRGNFWTNSLGSARLMQNVPTAGAAFAPWWDGQAGDQLTIASATASTVVVTTTPWTIGSEVGKTVFIDSGAAEPVSGLSLKGVVTANTTNELTIAGTWASANPGGAGNYTWTTNPTTGNLHIADGKWGRYNHISGRDLHTIVGIPGTVRENTGTAGDNWGVEGFGGFGATISFMHSLKEQHPTAPYFRAFKWTAVGGMSGWGNSGSATWLEFVDEWDEALLAYGADTPIYRAVVIDASGTDILASNTAFGTDFISFVTNIRAYLGAPDVPIIIVMHASQFLAAVQFSFGGGVTAPFASLVRGYINTVRGILTNVRVVDLEGYEFASDNLLGSLGYETGGIMPGVVSTNPTAYTADTHILLGQKVANTIARFYEVGPAIQVGGGIPTFILIGDSQCAGSTSPLYATLGGAGSLLGPAGANIMGEQLIWDDVDQAIEPYDLTSNSNTLGFIGVSQYGPDAAMLRQLGKDYPDGLLLIKMGVGGASMTAEAAGSGGVYDPVVVGDLWDQLGVAWGQAVLACVRDLGLLPDPLGVAVLLGDLDIANDAGAAAFATKLPGFVAALRTRFTKRVTGPPLPVVWSRPAIHVDDGGISNFGTAANRNAVRNAITSLAASDAAFFVTTDDGLELRRDEGSPPGSVRLHYGAESNDLIGLRLADLLLDASSVEGETETDGSLSVSATFVVEDGSGLTSANSYASVALMRSYWQHMGNVTSVASASDLTVQNALRESTAYVDKLYGSRFKGTKATRGQRLLWPRIGAVGEDGYEIYSNEIPTRLAEAVAEAAKRRLDGEVLLPDQSIDEQSAGASSITVGPITVSDNFVGSTQTRPRFYAVEMLMRGLLTDSGSRSMVRITR